MGFGKLNAVDRGQTSGSDDELRQRLTDYRRRLLWATLGIVTPIILLFGFNPHLRSWAWWFGPKRETPFMVAFALGVFALSAISNWFDTRQRRGRQQRRECGGDGGGDGAWPDWCTDTTGGGESGGDGGGGDGGGGD